MASFTKPNQDIALYHYDFSLPPSKALEITPNFIPTYEYKKVIGYYPPFLLINASELESLFHKNGIVLFDVKKAYQYLSLEDFLVNHKPPESQGLLIPESLLL